MEIKKIIFKYLNLFWILIAFIPFFNGIGFIYAGWRVNNTRWIDEGIIYMIPFVFLSFTIINDMIIYSAVILWVIGILRAILITKEFLDRLYNSNINEQFNNQNSKNDYYYQKIIKNNHDESTHDNKPSMENKSNKKSVGRKIDL